MKGLVLDSSDLERCLKKGPSGLCDLDRRRPIMFTNGKFEVFHPGHAHLLRVLRRMGMRLFVGVNSDASFLKVAGRMPVFPAWHRMDVVSRYADFVTAFDDATPLELVARINPDAIAKGDDWANRHVVGSTVVGDIVFVKRLEGWSSTKLLEDIRSETFPHPASPHNAG